MGIAQLSLHTTTTYQAMYMRSIIRYCQCSWVKVLRQRVHAIGRRRAACISVDTAPKALSQATLAHNCPIFFHILLQQLDFLSEGHSMNSIYRPLVGDEVRFVRIQPGAWTDPFDAIWYITPCPTLKSIR
jgi:hypothetical protein